MGLMDIETKTWRIKSDATPGATLIKKETGESKYIPNGQVPHSSYLAHISENQMNNEMQKLWNKLS